MGGVPRRMQVPDAGAGTLRRRRRNPKWMKVSDTGWEGDTEGARRSEEDAGPWQGCKDAEGRRGPRAKAGP